MIRITESRNVDHDIASIKYLIQTVTNYQKFSVEYYDREPMTESNARFRVDNETMSAAVQFARQPRLSAHCRTETDHDADCGNALARQ